MRVSITQEKRKAGLLGGKIEWQTSMTITATEEEKAIVSECNLGKFDIVSLPTVSIESEQDLNVDRLISTKTMVTSTNKWHANQMAGEMKAAAAKIKALIEETMADETGEFDL